MHHEKGAKMVTDEEVLLHGFSDEDRRSFLAMGKELHFEADDVIIEESVPGASLHVILEGDVSVWKRNVKLATLSKGAVVGELVIFRQHPRSATVRADGSVRTLMFEKSDIMAYFRWRDERLFKILVINVIYVLSRKLAKASERTMQLENRLQSEQQKGPSWAHTSIS